MTYVREPVLQPVPIESLRPTQIRVGMREVEEKRKRLRKQKPQKIGAFLGHHMIPVVSLLERIPRSQSKRMLRYRPIAQIVIQGRASRAGNAG
jgi:hypothetical protein